MAELLVIGGASLDVLHSSGRTERCAGGAGLYTALAASRSGVRVTMFAPVPDPMPPMLAPAAARIRWIGPTVPPEDLPRFEILNRPGGRAELIHAFWGAEARLDPADAASTDADWVYCVPLTDPAKQLAFVRHYKAAGCRVAFGTYNRLAAERPDAVRAAIEIADAFFCNEPEAAAVYGAPSLAKAVPGRLVFLTRGPQGARVLQGGHATDVPGVPAWELDPTGAGDTFCGTVLAFLARGEHPVGAAARGAAHAAEMIEAFGPAALLSSQPPPDTPPDPRVRVDDGQVARVAALLATLDEVRPFDFATDLFPPPGDAGVLDFLFAATVQQFGFWSDRDGRYDRPMIAAIGGRRLKGSDYLWAAYERWRRADARGLTPARQAGLTDEELATRLRADDGSDPHPALALAATQARAYGEDMAALGWTPRELVARANASPLPAAALLTLLDHVGGYKEDPLRKKSALLAAILRERPEGFLRRVAGDDVPPIVDYHVQRSCLRLGLARVDDQDLARRLAERRILPPADEWAVRRVAFDAVRALADLSQKPMAACDSFLFRMRERCPEMSEPDCVRCPADPACAHRKELFQPVIRTPFY